MFCVFLFKKENHWEVTNDSFAVLGRDSSVAPHSQVTTPTTSNSVDHIKEITVHPLPSNDFVKPKDVSCFLPGIRVSLKVLSM